MDLRDWESTESKNSIRYSKDRLVAVPNWRFGYDKCSAITAVMLIFLPLETKQFFVGLSVAPWETIPIFIGVLLVPILPAFLLTRMNSLTGGDSVKEQDIFFNVCTTIVVVMGAIAYFTGNFISVPPA